ncbi:MAG TPA: hypothetical protein VKC53_00170 [Patescibacteria group bacterium]|nr:hypothetical protein [Patescibacteria group bacterium]
MNNERLLLINDNLPTLDLLSRILSREHEIVASISSAIEFKQKLEDGSLVGSTVAIVDDRMPREGMGKGIAQKLRQDFPNIKIISFSGQLQDWGDVNLRNSPDTSIGIIRKAVLDLQTR